MASKQSTEPHSHIAQIAMPQEVFERLLANGAVHSSDCRSLNHTAKQVIWQTLLNNSVKAELC